MSDYTQLLIHLVSDYWLQNDYMATNKKNNPNIALFHAMIYTIPFLLLTHSLLALGAICISHAIIDGSNLVCELNQVKNWNFSTKSGYSEFRPSYIWVWLIIIQDNILHLVINYLSLKYL